MSRSFDHGGNISALARDLAVPSEQLIDFSASISPLGVSTAVRQALTDSIDALVNYPDPDHEDLKRALAEYHGLQPENFAVGNGSTEFIYAIPKLLTGRRALLISPSFSEYERALDLHGWRVDHFYLSPADGFAIDLKKLELALADGVDLLFFCNPGNPTGVLYPLTLVEEILSICRSAGVFMVLDEAFMDFSEECSAKNVIAAGVDQLLLRSMTKFFGIPGLRLGYVVGNGDLVSRISRASCPWNVNSLALAAGVVALSDVAQNEKTISVVRRERDLLFDALSKFSGFYPYKSSANYILVEITGETTAAELQRKLFADMILIRDCSSFAGLSDRFFRVAVKNGEQNRMLIECLKRVL